MDQKNYELKYKYTRYGRVLSYEPDPDLAEWLTMIDEFTQYFKEKRTKRTPQRIKQAGIIRYLAHKKKVLQEFATSNE